MYSQGTKFLKRKEVKKISSNIILEKNIKLKTLANNWMDAMRLSGQLLVDSEFIKSGYIEATIKNVNEYGPYIVIAPGIALSHSRPDENVLKTGISLLTLREPVHFNCENDPVDIILTLAAVDDTDHLALLEQLSCYLSEDGKLDYIRSCSDTNKLAKELNEYEVIM